MVRKKEIPYYQIVMINGGLGSQMVKYAFYILLTKKCPDRMNMIDTFFYQCERAWNGYELNRIFDIKPPDISDFYDLPDVRANDYFKAAYDFMLKKQPHTEVIRVSRGEYTYFNSKFGGIKKLKDKIFYKLKYLVVMNVSREAKKYGFYVDRYKRNIFKLNANVYFDEFNYTSDIYFREIREELKRVFTFPAFIDDKNRECCRMIEETESVILHVRRSDHMYDNGVLYESNYYEKAVSYIKEHVKRPVFFVFSDEVEWCEHNKDKLGMRDDDRIIFVNWNQREESFRDMQLMTYGKHNILAISSFSWWGYYLSKRDNKIVCAPNGFWLEVRKHF